MRLFNVTLTIIVFLIFGCNKDKSEPSKKDLKGKIKTMVDQNGNQYNFQYNGDGLISKITGSESLEFIWSESVLQVVDSQIGNSESYNRNGSGYILSNDNNYYWIYNSDNQVFKRYYFISEYTYNWSNGNLISKQLIDANNQTSTFQYDYLAKENTLNFGLKFAPNYSESFNSYTKNLINKMTRTFPDGTKQIDYYEYTYDSDDNVLSLKITRKDLQGNVLSPIENYTYTYY